MVLFGLRIDSCRFFGELGEFLCLRIFFDICCCRNIAFTPASVCLSTIGAQSIGLGAISIIWDEVSHATSRVTAADTATNSSMRTSHFVILGELQIDVEEEPPSMVIAQMLLLGMARLAEKFAMVWLTWLLLHLHISVPRIFSWAFRVV